LICLPEDRRICEALLAEARRRGDAGNSPGGRVAVLGRLFLGAPYKEAPLEREGAEELVINLRSFDCVTFVESCLALANLAGEGKAGFAEFAAALERIRYRRGKRDGYASRLHYFTDWLFDNGRKGILRDVTPELGGIPLRKEFHALTDRRGEIPALADAAEFRRMRIVEALCSRRLFWHIPRESLRRIEDRIAEGDLIAVTTGEEGIDVIHTGIAVREGRSLQLLHASRRAGQVVLSETGLLGYLRAGRNRAGVVVARAGPGFAPVPGGP
jgi:hypothetical protein